MSLSRGYKKFITHQTSGVGNWAEYQMCEPYVCCGNMDLHDDRDSNNGQRFFSFRAKYWHPDYVLVVFDKQGEVQQQVTRTSKVVTFDSTMIHGFMPKEVAQALVADGESSEVYKEFEYHADEQVVPKLIWEWIDTK